MSDVVKPETIIAEHRWRERDACCACGWEPDYRNTHTSGIEVHGAHVVERLAAHGHTIVPSAEPTRTSRYSVGNLATQVWTEDANSSFGTSPLLHIGHPGRYTMIPARLAVELASAILSAAAVSATQEER